MQDIPAITHMQPLSLGHICSFFIMHPFVGLECQSCQEKPKVRKQVEQSGGLAVCQRGNLSSCKISPLTYFPELKNGSNALWVLSALSRSPRCQNTSRKLRSGKNPKLRVFVKHNADAVMIRPHSSANTWRISRSSEWDFWTLHSTKSSVKLAASRTVINHTIIQKTCFSRGQPFITRDVLSHSLLIISTVVNTSFFDFGKQYYLHMLG